MNLQFMQTSDSHLVCIFEQAEVNVIDLGYHDGSFEKDVQTVFPNYNYMAVEADPKYNSDNSTKVIKKLVAKNSCENRQFEIEPRGLGSSTAVLVEGNDKGTIPVETISLQDVYLEADFDEVNLLKIDIEGSEFEILDEETVRFLSKNTKQVCIEFHDWIAPHYCTERREIIERFSDQGFFCVRVSITNHGAYTLLNCRLLDLSPIQKAIIKIEKYRLAYKRLLRRLGFVRKG